ncbi:alpha/beta hydrolase [Phenylobacterium sp.]|uniref:alpha/beta hydrolase n=1 Tax=Phenylobacterium sp. TaxID=1871053 RepID=UPI002733C3C7|nr:alpha/beta hydrolase [Phenylobacterium sp.]MDP3631934.1 alpha/beta hydrolase [Phenylobacterium sp.]MDZ4055176.1 alpha/beta hydrolase [Phenylobacterium sp.]
MTDTDLRGLLAAGLLTPALMGATSAKAAAKPSEGQMIELWPNGAPGGSKVTVTETATDVVDKGQTGRDISGITRPRFSLHRPKMKTDTAMLVIAGGAFNRVVFDKEGEEVCRWLADKGVAAGALLYRLPGDGWDAGQDAPVQDAQRALRLLIRETGAKRVGIMGFSAGGTIAGALVARAAETLYPPVDAADKLSAMPSFMCLGYPYLNVPKGPRENMFPGFTKATPPTFFFHAADDARVPVANSIQPFQELRAFGVPAALHVYESGAHGFGLRAAEGSSASHWPEHFLTWARAGGHIG